MARWGATEEQSEGLWKGRCGLGNVGEPEARGGGTCSQGFLQRWDGGWLGRQDWAKNFLDWERLKPFVQERLKG